MNEVRIRGAADAAEVAAVLALLAREGEAPAPGAYDRWRQQRLRVLGRRRTTDTRAW